MRARFGECDIAQRSGGSVGGEQKEQKSAPLDVWEGAAKFAALGERRAAADAVIVAKRSSAECDALGPAGVSTGAADNAGERRRQERRQELQQPEAQADTPAAVPAPMEVQAVGQLGQDTQLPSAEPRVAAAAAPHKRRAVAAETDVGEAVGVAGGKQPAGDEGKWTTVLSRRARRQEPTRLDGTTSGAARMKAAAARAAATRRKDGGGDH